MASFNDRTANFGFPKPHVKNLMADDCDRLRTALDGIDGEFASFQAILARYQTELVRLASRLSALETGGAVGEGGESGLTAMPVTGLELPGGATLAPVTIVKKGDLAPDGAALVIKFDESA